jgi:peptidoglycan L-alanyl-D-glutamate endopeptidase CwlK
MNFKFGKTSEEKLSTVNSQLASVARKALELSPIDFGITEGRRSIEKQQQLVAEGASQTMKSKHLTGHAIDIVCYEDGKITWDLKHYQVVANAVALACEELQVNIRWGGSWKVNDFSLDPENKFIDAVHFELIE